MSLANRRPTAEQDIRNEPAYATAEAARYLRIPSATLRSWFAGRSYDTATGTRHWKRLIVPASRNPLMLSFWNLIEAHVLWALRQGHQVSVAAVRKALLFAEQELGVEHLLLRKELCTDAGALFLRHYGQLIELSASGQIAMEQLLEAHLKRVEWDEWSFPVRLYPFLPAAVASEAHFVTIDPAIAFGRPVIEKRGVTTAVLADRIDAGESVEEVAEDFELTTDQVERAIMFERAA